MRLRVIVLGQEAADLVGAGLCGGRRGFGSGHDVRKVLDFLGLLIAGGQRCSGREGNGSGPGKVLAHGRRIEMPTYSIVRATGLAEEPLYSQVSISTKIMSSLANIQRPLQRLLPVSPARRPGHDRRTSLSPAVRLKPSLSKLAGAYWYQDAC